MRLTERRVKGETFFVCLPQSSRLQSNIRLLPSTFGQNPVVGSFPTGNNEHLPSRSGDGHGTANNARYCATFIAHVKRAVECGCWSASWGIRGGGLVE